MPGHVNAALSSYAKLSCDGGARRALHGHRGRVQLALHPQGASRTRSSTTSSREVAALTPGRVPAHRRRRGARRPTRPSTAPSSSASQRIVRAHGKRMIGWEEIAQTPPAPVDRRAALARRRRSRRARSRRARELVMSPATKAYLDMKYDAGLRRSGSTGRARRRVRDAYGWDPATQVPGVAARRRARRRGAALDGDDRRRAPTSTSWRSRGSLGHAEIGVVAGRAVGVAGLPPPPRRPRPAARGAGRRLLPVARGALALTRVRPGR